MNQELHETIHEMVNTCAGIIARNPHPQPTAGGTGVAAPRPAVNPGGAPGLPPNFAGVASLAATAGSAVNVARQLPPGNLFQKGIKSIQYFFIQQKRSFRGSFIICI